MPPITDPPDRLRPLADELARAGRDFWGRGWLPGTSGSLSARSGQHHDDPLSILVTVSGKDKGRLDADDFLLVTDDGQIYDQLGDPQASSEALFEGHKKPSGEVLVHRALYLAAGDRAGAVLHTHSIFAVLASERVPAHDRLELPPIEMLKGLGHWQPEPLHIPVIPNHRHIPDLANSALDALDPRVPGVLVAGHGLYVHGPDLDRARRHLESLEFLLEYIVRRSS